MSPREADDKDEIPIIDLSNPDQSQLIDQLHRACSTWGFFQLINHGIPSQLLDSFRQVICNFFALPYDVKLRLKRHAKNSRGYFDDELTKRKRDWKEAIDVGMPGGREWGLPDDDGENACLDGYNQFPSEDDCPKFRDVVVEYFQECSKLSSHLAMLMALALCGEGTNDEDIEKFLGRMEGEHTSYLRMNYYPPCTEAEHAKPASSGPLGISPHRDAGFLTVLLQDDNCSSLQVARFEDDDDIEEDEKWVTVRPVPGAITINTGDMAMICSNGRFRAPLHRVLTDPEKKRYSAPFFYNPGYNEWIGPFVTGYVTNNDDIDEDRRSLNDDLRYHPCLWGYFRALRFAGDLTDLGVEIQTSHYKIESESSHIERQKRFMELVNFKEPFDVEQYRRILTSD
jgi:isopenicillin N synthase-like dioxygenase